MISATRFEFDGWTFGREEQGYEEARSAAVWNARTPERYPELIDFATPMVPGQDYLPGDLDHMSQSGQNKRAVVARHELEG